MDPKILHSYGFSSIKPWDDEFNPFYKEFMKHEKKSFSEYRESIMAENVIIRNI